MRWFLLLWMGVLVVSGLVLSQNEVRRVHKAWDDDVAQRDTLYARDLNETIKQVRVAQSIAQDAIREVLRQRERAEREHERANYLNRLVALERMRAARYEQLYFGMRRAVDADSAGVWIVQ